VRKATRNDFTHHTTGGIKANEPTVGQKTAAAATTTIIITFNAQNLSL